MFVGTCIVSFTNKVNINNKKDNDVTQEEIDNNYDILQND